jgi:hypothetical protein
MPSLSTNEYKENILINTKEKEIEDRFISQTIETTILDINEFQKEMKFFFIYRNCVFIGLYISILVFLFYTVDNIIDIIAIFNRVMIGFHFAMFITRIILILIIKNFRYLSLNDDYFFSISIGLISIFPSSLDFYFKNNKENYYFQNMNKIELNIINNIKEYNNNNNNTNTYKMNRNERRYAINNETKKLFKIKCIEEDIRIIL